MIPPNFFITIRIVTSGQSVCIQGNNCTSFIQAESPEFITFNNNSKVTKLPNNGIRSTVPTPAPNTTITSTITAPTILITQTSKHSLRPQLTSDSITTTPEPVSNKTPTIAAGVAGSVGGFLLGGVASALLFLFCLKPKKRPESPKYEDVRISQPFTPHARTSDVPGPLPRAESNSPPDAAIFESEESSSSNTWATADPSTSSHGRGTSATSPQWLGRWQGGTRYHPVSPGRKETGYAGPRRIATLDFRSVQD